jgi:hypothetical protein
MKASEFLLLSLLLINICAAPVHADIDDQDDPAIHPNLRLPKHHGFVSRPYPEASTTEMRDLLCYMQTSKGKVLNLNRLCFGGLVRRLLTTGECRNCDFSNITLADQDLSNVDLSGANFTNAILNGANLSGSNLKNANLSGASTEGANFRNTNFRNAIMPNGQRAQ